MWATKSPDKCKDTGLGEGRDVDSCCMYFCSELRLECNGGAGDGLAIL